MDVTNEEHTELVFEDPFGDEFEEEEPDDAPEGATVDERVFRSGIDKLADGEQLVLKDPSVYDTLQRLTVDWPAMTVDAVGVGTNSEYTNAAAFFRRAIRYPPPW